MDAIRRSYFNVDGTKKTGLDVKAIGTLNGVAALMPETTPGVSGIYSSTSEIQHGEYVIWVNDQPTDDTQVVEPGRHYIDVYDGQDPRFPHIDRSLNECVRVSNFLPDNNNPTYQEKHDAFALAIRSGFSKTIILDVYDVILQEGIVSNGAIFLDLNGYSLDLAAFSINCAGKATVFNGSLASSGGKIYSDYNNLFMNVTLQDYGRYQCIDLGAKSVYIACDGAIGPASNTGAYPPVVIGSEVGSADRLRLTDSASDNAGKGRLDKLQSFVDTHIDSTIDNTGAYGWLTTERKNNIDANLALPVSKAGKKYTNVYGYKFFPSLGLEAPNRGYDELGLPYGFRNGCETIYDKNGLIEKVTLVAYVDRFERRDTADGTARWGAFIEMDKDDAYSFLVGGQATIVMSGISLPTDGLIANNHDGIVDLLFNNFTIKPASFDFPSFSGNQYDCLLINFNQSASNNILYFNQGSFQMFRFNSADNLTRQYAWIKIEARPYSASSDKKFPHFRGD